MTEDEIDKVLEYERSPVGRKSTAVSQEVVPLWVEYLAGKNDAQFTEGIQNFATNLKSFIAKKRAEQDIQN